MSSENIKMERKHYVRVAEDVYIDQWGPPLPDGMKRLGTVIVVVVLAIALHSIYATLMRAKSNAARTSCQSNYEVLGIAFIQYAQDNDECFPAVHGARQAHYPQAYGWADALQPYARTLAIYQCPAEGHGPVNNPTERNYTDYWYNRRLSGIAQQKINSPTQTILAGDGNDGTDQTDARYSLSALPSDWLTDESKPSFRHLGGANYLFADGHCKWLKPDAIGVKPVVVNNYRSYTFATTQLPVKREH
ncbi:MAG: hypothetical protein JO316_21640 [Abitibacteriaceae bacterium]|nr:hypothetical protein [Abditibacteriaceae bacterium]